MNAVTGAELKPSLERYLAVCPNLNERRDLRRYFWSVLTGAADKTNIHVDQRLAGILKQFPTAVAPGWRSEGPMMDAWRRREEERRAQREAERIRHQEFMKQHEPALLAEMAKRDLRYRFAHANHQGR